jgi:hypothetical protein
MHSSIFKPMMMYLRLRKVGNLAFWCASGVLAILFWHEQRSLCIVGSSCAAPRHLYSCSSNMYSNCFLKVSFSFLIFPKPFTASHVAGGAVIIASLYAFSRKQPRPKAKASPKVAEYVPDEFSGWKGRRSPFSSEGFDADMDPLDEAPFQCGMTGKWSAM